MEPKISEGDRIIISPSASIENGQIAVIANDNNEQTPKRIYFKGQNQILFTSDNHKYPPIIWTEKDKPRIIGRVVRVIKKYKD